MTELIISRGQLRANFLLFSNLLGSANRVIPVVKANAYGHGDIEVIRMLRPLHPWGFGVASSAEALILRQHGIRDRLIILSSWDKNDLAALLRTRTEFVIWNQLSAADIAAQARRLGIIARVHMKIDTGTSRIGFFPQHAHKALRKISSIPSIRVSGVFSHFADAEGKSLKFAKQQWLSFVQATNFFPPHIMRHMSCTAAALRFPKANADAARIGIGLYTTPQYPGHRNNSRQFPKPVLSWETRILQIKNVPPKTSVGYARSFITTNKTKIAVIPVGYADGLPRSLSNRGRVLIKSRLCPIIGRICMNLSMIDVSALPLVIPGDRVTLIGRQGKSFLNASDLARDAGTIDYEILSRLPAHIPRRYV